MFLFSLSFSLSLLSNVQVDYLIEKRKKTRIFRKNLETFAQNLVYFFVSKKSTQRKVGASKLDFEYRSSKRTRNDFQFRTYVLSDVNDSHDQRSYMHMDAFNILHQHKISKERSRHLS